MTAAIRELLSWWGTNNGRKLIFNRNTQEVFENYNFKISMAFPCEHQVAITNNPLLSERVAWFVVVKPLVKPCLRSIPVLPNTLQMLSLDWFTGIHGNSRTSHISSCPFSRPFNFFQHIDVRNYNSKQQYIFLWTRMIGFHYSLKNKLTCLSGPSINIQICQYMGKYLLTMGFVVDP